MIDYNVPAIIHIPRNANELIAKNSLSSEETCPPNCEPPRYDASCDAAQGEQTKH